MVTWYNGGDYFTPMSFLRQTLPFFVFAALLIFPATAFAGSGTPGDGFQDGDDCGYVLGTSTLDAYAAGGGTVYADDVDDAYQACYDESGYFLEDSYLYSDAFGWLDLAWDSSTDNLDVIVDQSTGYFEGYAWNDAVGWVWFDWTCASCTSADYEEYYVHVDESGILSGYAWNDLVGWISFNDLTLELAPVSVTAYVEVETFYEGGSVLNPDEVDYETAPYADGFQSYRVKVTFLDNDTGDYLDESDFDALSVDVDTSSDTLLYLDQTKNEGDGLLISEVNAGQLGCQTSGEVTLGSCVIDEGGGETSFNTFVFAATPTSNMLGIDANQSHDLDDEVSFATDRDGCLNFYDDQSATTCEGSSAVELKEDHFDLRSSSRNFVELEQVNIELTLSGDRDVEVLGLDKSVSGASYTYDLSYELSYKPRFDSDDFYVQDSLGEQYNYVLAYEGLLGEPEMQLYQDFVMADMPEEYYTACGSSSCPSTEWVLHTQLDNDSSTTEKAWDVKFLLASGDAGPSTLDATYDHYDSDSDGSQSVVYKVGYEQLESYTSSCAPSCLPPENDISNPTAESWVCDAITEDSFGSSACYYVGYLPRALTDAPAEDMLVIGAVNEALNDDLLDDLDDVSVLGSTSYITTRNTIFATVARLVRGQNPVGSGTLDSSMEPTSSTSIVELMGGRLLYAKGNVTIQGSDNFDEKTLVVVGGDVYIEGNIENETLGIIVFRSGGKGGNVYRTPEVTDIWANLFIDGALFSYDGSSGGIGSDGVPTWSSDDSREEGLNNQLYLFGSLVSRNFITSDESAGSWTLGDGTETSEWPVAREYNLNTLSEFHLCYALDADGNVDTSTTQDCENGEERSGFLMEDGSESDAPFIVEYSAPSDTLPVFNTSGLELTTQ